MAFVDRDKAGAIVAAYASKQRPGQEEVADSAPAVVALRNPAPTALELRRAAYPDPAELVSAAAALLVALADGEKPPASALDVARQVVAIDAKFPLD